MLPILRVARVHFPILLPNPIPFSCHSVSNGGSIGLAGLSNNAALYSIPNGGLWVHCISFLGFPCIHPRCLGKVGIHGKVVWYVRHVSKTHRLHKTNYVSKSSTAIT